MHILSNYEESDNKPVHMTSAPFPRGGSTVLTYWLRNMPQRLMPKLDLRCNNIH